MLRWHEVRRLIPKVVGPSLGDLGFQNPGRTMWRFRPLFIDVIHFECGKWNTRFWIEFGCAVRIGARLNPRPWHCEFRASPEQQFEWELDWFAFQEAEAMQIQCLANLSPRVSDAAALWFKAFECIDSAIFAQQTRPWQVGAGNPGSPWFNHVMERLKLAKSLQ